MLRRFGCFEVKLSNVTVLPCGNLKFTSASCFATIFPYFRADHF